ncbi:hypothetical protein BC827DRAFT_543669 [Russula dissimulans]|nr:hypothetical protein BC827DRAFT_543669 [Russula dissimulans]
MATKASIALISSRPRTRHTLRAMGQTGPHLICELIASPTFTRVCEAGRRHMTPAEELPAEGRRKFEQKVIDFERLKEMRVALDKGKWDVVFITMRIARPCTVYRLDNCEICEIKRNLQRLMRTFLRLHASRAMVQP